MPKSYEGEHMSLKDVASNEISNMLNTIEKQPHAFTPEEVLSFANLDIDRETPEDTLKHDSRYIRLGKGALGEDYFIVERAIFLWYSRLSIRLAQARKARLSSQQVAKLISSSARIVIGRFLRLKASNLDNALAL